MKLVVQIPCHNEQECISEVLNSIPKTAPQYDSAKLLLVKINKRQDELLLEKKIRDHESISDSTGKILPVELSEISTPSGISESW